MKKFRSVFCVLLCAFTLLAFAACGSAPADTQQETAVYADGDTVGSGSLSCTLVIADREGSEISLTLHTDASTLGQALAELELAAGKQSSNGLYIETVNGLTARYEDDGCYWSVYVGDTPSSVGADSIVLEEGGLYMLRIEKM